MLTKGLLRVPMGTITKESKPVRLGMALMVYNEEDIIEINIRYHAAIGVDCFLIINNGSTDATNDILDSLASEFEIHIVHIPKQSYQQSQWMTMLNREAIRHGCDLVINNDADEFYIVQAGNKLKNMLLVSDSLIEIKRFNMLLTDDYTHPGYAFWHSQWRVDNPIAYSVATQLAQANISISLAKISPKVITNPHGLIRVKGGNHRAKHMWGWFNARKECAIWVAHYPFRSYPRFKQSIEHRKALLHNGARMGYHYKRWVKLYDMGELEKEFNRQVFAPKQLEMFENTAIVKHTLEPQNAIQSSYMQP